MKSEDYQDVMNEMMETKKLIAEMDVENQEIYVKNQEMNIKNHEMDVKNQAMELKIQELTDELDNLKHSRHEGLVAFHAYLGSDKTFEDGSTIVFDTVIANIGGAYAPAVGVFQCPVSGYYFFAVSIISNTERANARIMMNSISSQDGPLTSHGATPSSYRSGMSTQTLITECQAGSIVFVQAQRYNQNSYPAAALIASYPTFSGFLLYQTE